MSIPKIAIGFPSKDEVKADTTMALTAMTVETAIRGLGQFALLNQKGSMISHQRNELVRKALEFDVDYLMWIDSDMVFPTQAVAGLLRRNKDIVGATYNRRVPPYDTLGRLVDSKDIFNGGCKPAIYLPGGMCLVKMDVYRKIPEPWYFETYAWAGETPVDSFMSMLADNSLNGLPTEVENELRQMKTLRPWLESQRNSPLFGNPVISEDINFCRKAAAYGYDLWCDIDLTYQIIHIAEHGIIARPDVKEAHQAEAPGTPQTRLPLKEAANAA